MKDKVSVIVPVYNTGKHLHKCIDSILCQSYRNLDLILINDGSTDDSDKICDYYSAIDARVQVIHNRHEGVSEARNIGLRMAEGTYICFVDSDDYIAKDMLEKLYGLIKQFDADLSICGKKQIYEDENIKTIEADDTVIVLNNIEMLNKYMKEQATLTTLTAKLYKKTLFENIRFPKGKISEDDHVSYLIYYKINRAVQIGNALYYRLKRKDSITGKPFNKSRLDIFHALSERTVFFKNNGLDDLYQKSAVYYLKYFAVSYRYLKLNSKLDKATEMYIERMFKKEYHQYKDKIKINIYERVYLSVFKQAPSFHVVAFCILECLARKLKMVK